MPIRQLISEVSKCMRISGGERWGSLVQQNLTSVWLQPNTRASGDGRRQQESQTRNPRPAGFLGPTSLGRDGVVRPVLDAAAVQRVPPARASAELTQCQIVLESLQRSVFSKPPSAALPPASPLPGTGSREIRVRPRASSAGPQRGCAGHVRLSGVPAIGCDVTSGVSGESREGERESEQAAGSRRAGGRHGRRERTSEQ